jgi:polar amino acid transport system substrate-binding protein
MRKVLGLIAISVLLLAACAEDDPTVGATGGAGETGATGATAPATAEACAADNQASLFEPGVLTVGTDFGFMFPPWILKNDPTAGKGFEAATAYEVAARMGFEASQVEWVDVPFNKSYAPGEKDFDFDINNISVTEERDQAVDFSDGYYDLTQALVVLKGSPFENATTMAELSDAVFGAQIGSTSLDFINTVIMPTEPAKVYDTTGDAKTALRNGDVDGLVLDLPTAYYEANISPQSDIQELVGQFPSAGEHLGMLFEEGNPLVGCVNLALAEMSEDGTLEELQTKWLADYLAVPVIQ